MRLSPGDEVRRYVINKLENKCAHYDSDLGDKTMPKLDDVIVKWPVPNHLFYQVSLN